MQPHPRPSGDTRMVCAPPAVEGLLRSTAAAALRCSHLINHQITAGGPMNGIRSVVRRLGSLENDRNNKVQRRERLRRLDVVLSGEIEQAGAMSLDELQAEVRDRKLLGRPTKPATVKEWWDYAIKRAVLEDTNPNSARLSDFGRQELALARRRQLSSLAPAARATLKNVVLPSVVALVALALKSPEVALGAGAVGVLVFLWWVLAEMLDWLVKFMNPTTSRSLAAANAAWLDGDELKPRFLRFPALPAGTTMQRLYERETIGTLAAGSNLTLPPDEATTSRSS
jgi:hypothetical protein